MQISNPILEPFQVRTLHDLCEWQLVDPERFRKLLRSDEDTENWRVYPIGFDSLDNTYWLFDDNRLWIQYPPPPPPPKPRAPPKKGSKRARAEAAAAKRAAAVAQSKPGTGKRVASSSCAPTPSKKSRPSVTSVTGKGTPVRTGSRASRRLRGNADAFDEGWEAIPPELLKSEVADDSIDRKGNVDSESELSEPPSAKAEEEDENENDKAGLNAEADDSKMSLDDDDDPGNSAQKVDTTDKAEQEWVEYETVAVTRSEWEAIQFRWAKSKHPDEKALHSILAKDVCPRVLADIAETEKQAALEAAMAMRKRSSRIATKEAEREEERKQSEARAAMEERMKRLRAEEEERERKENEAKAEERRREDRLREREERAMQREREAERKALAEIEERERREKMREMRQRKRELVASGQALPADFAAAISGSGGDDAATENDEDWDLGCEICLKAGRNLELNADEQIVCCESCLVWQHTKCWDSFDAWRSQPPRNWDAEDFFCTACREQRSAPGTVDKAAIAAKQEAYRASLRPVTPATKKITVKRTNSGVKKESGSGTASPMPETAGPDGIAPLPSASVAAANTSQISSYQPGGSQIPGTQSMVSSLDPAQTRPRPPTQVQGSLPTPHVQAQSLQSGAPPGLQTQDLPPHHQARPMQPSALGSPSVQSSPARPAATLVGGPAAPPASATSSRPIVPVQDRVNGGTPNAPLLSPHAPTSNSSQAGTQNGHPVPRGHSSNGAALPPHADGSATNHAPAQSSPLASPRTNNPYPSSSGQYSPSNQRSLKPAGSTPTGSFPIRRPTVGAGGGLPSAAKSPLGGPSIVSPGRGGSEYSSVPVPPITLGATGQGSAGPLQASSRGPVQESTRPRMASPTPAGRAGGATSMALASTPVPPPPALPSLGSAISSVAPVLPTTSQPTSSAALQETNGVTAAPGSSEPRAPNVAQQQQHKRQ